MKNRGFTLIEILVVVLIIGILAAIAVPKYQLAVDKAKTREGLLLLKSLVQAGDVYFLANGTYPERLSDFDVSISSYTGSEKAIADSSYVKDTKSNDYWSLQIYKVGNKPLGNGNYLNQYCLYMTPIKGKYTRNTLMYCFYHSDAQVPENKISCYERNVQNHGDFCVRFFDGKPFDPRYQNAFEI